VGRTLLEAENAEIFKTEVGMAIGQTQTDRLVSINPTTSNNPFPTSIAIALNTTTQIRAKVFARQRAGDVPGQSGCFELIGTFKNINGTVTQVDTTTTVCSHNDDNNWTVTLSLSGERVLINCVYVDPALENGNTIIWTLYVYTFTVGE
jgi:hypothetical protein